MKRSVLTLLLALLAFYVLVCLSMFLLQERLLYFPGGPPEISPADVGLDFEDLRLTTRDGVAIHGWLLPAEAPRGAVVFSHGNAGNIAHRLAGARAFLEMGLSVLLYDYRGYGLSEGSPDEEGTYLDAEAAHGHLVEAAGFDPARIVSYGESLGGAVAIELARRRPVGAVITESAFTSATNLGAELYPWLPVRLLSRIGYDNAAKIGDLGVPVLLVHSPDDEIVPIRHAHALLAAAREPKELLETGAGHNDGGFPRRTEWCKAVAAFVERALGE